MNLLTRRQIKAYSEQHIPYRVVNLEMGMFAVMLIQRKLADKSGSLTIGDAIEFKKTGPRIFANLAVEAGIVYSRVLLNFLGIYKEHHKPKLVARRPQARFADSEVWIERFPRGRLLTVSELCSSFPESQSPQKMYWHVVRTLDAANRGVAHLTLPRKRANSIDGFRSDSLYFTCMAVRHHILKHFYENTLGREAPAMLKAFDANTDIKFT